MLYDKVLAFVPPFQKLNLLKQIIKVPPDIEKILRRIFSLRNVLAHVFTIDYTKDQEVEYSGRSIFDISAFEKYAGEADKAIIYLIEKLNIDFETVN